MLHNISTHNVVELGISQYSFEEGASACTVIASAAMRHLLIELTLSSAYSVDLDVLRQIVIDGVAQFARSGLGQHLAVDKLGHTFFQPATMADNGLLHGMLQVGAFTRLIQQVRSVASSRTGYVGVVITKPPETIALLLPLSQTGAAEASRYFFFDSHSRPHLGHDSAYLLECGNEDTIVACLESIFPPLPLDPFDDHSRLDEFTMMYNMFEASVFVI
jgi:hypothetical protein